MKKLKHVMMIGVAIIMLFMMATNVKAEESTLTWTDSSKIEVSLTKEEASDKYYHVFLNVKGFEKMGGDTNRTYYIYIKNGNEAPIVPETGRIENADYIVAVESGEYKYQIDEWIGNAGDVYVWIYEGQNEAGDASTKQNKCIVSGVKLERPEQNKVGEKIQCYLFNTNTTTFLYEPGKSNRKVNVKIGTITDNNAILKSIKNGEKDGLEKLLAYGKNAKSIYSTTVFVGVGGGPAIAKNLNLVNKQYYYAYLTVENADGTWYPVEDIGLYQATVDERYNIKNLTRYGDKNFTWELAEEPTKNPETPAEKPDDKTEKPANTNKPSSDRDNTTATGKLPQTGLNTVVIISIIGIVGVIAIIGAMKYKKYNIKY